MYKRSVTVSLSLAVLLAAVLVGCSKSEESEAAAPGASAGELSRAARLQPMTLPEGTELQVRLTPTLSTKTHNVGDAFDGTLAEPLVVGNSTIAAKGATVQGKVVEADKGGRVKGRARLAVQLTHLETSSGQMVEIATSSVARQARATKGKDAQKVGIGAGVGAAVGAIAGGGKGAAIGAGAGAGAGTGAVLATRGDPAVLPSETLLTFRLRYPVEIR